MEASVEHFKYAINKTLLSPNSPEFGMLVTPILSYWLVASFYDMLDILSPSFLQQFRVTRISRGPDNRLSKGHVVQRVLLQHLIQFSLGMLVVLVDTDQCTMKPAKGWVQSCLQFGLGMFIMDTYQFWIHRWMHVNRYLYKHLHSHHHRLNIPYAYGALYNHPLEALLLDTLGGVITLYASGMSCEVGTWLMTFATIKTVLDHSGYIFPINPLHDLFPNSAAYHDIHHDVRNIKKNYSQPFFTHWDWLMGSYMSSEGFHLHHAGKLSSASSSVKCLASDEALLNNAGPASDQEDAASVSKEKTS
ncbi:hypothetical protein CEUSTIGMA_g12932.t1 [Chlamydomonas eustigma]|uniref:Fatty acid hydroxylase domain-containing protein n=1 Tax=Chlamydomonas eustigma TaxID=1157962 RepID=A0A250XR46_9CHLO|nr:hypothetical protein CEUSTIGMA_g12932.t1 [Chlamydomonas eustigma]|eukprot:GAX85516.1 hypothetical protein CEUSTIGMA_g12932.t1 [Chlamydomonas eustigma]